MRPPRHCARRLPCATDFATVAGCARRWTWRARASVNWWRTTQGRPRGTGDVESALAAAAARRTRKCCRRRSWSRARISLRLAEVRYREGADDLLTLLDAQRTLFQAEDQLAQIRLSR